MTHDYDDYVRSIGDGRPRVHADVPVAPVGSSPLELAQFTAAIQDAAEEAAAFEARQGTMPARVLIVDDHPAMLAGLRGLLSGEPDLELCGEAGSAAAAVKAIESSAPDVIILDLFLGADDDIEFVGRIHARWPRIRILVVSMQDEALFAERILAMGARGFVMKREASQVVLAAVRKVIAGEYFVSAALGERLFARKARARYSSNVVDVLTAREREVLADIAVGKSTQEISKHLGMHFKTVDSHRRSMREKLGLKSAAELVRYAVQWAQPGGPPQDEDAVGE
jgi:DNA-binding NarL/FixJ family response regulator